MANLENLETPFLTFTNAIVEPGYMGDEAELTALHRRTEALDYALREGKEFDVLLDMLAEDNQNPIEYVEQVEANIQTIITYQLIPEDWDYWQDKF